MKIAIDFDGVIHDQNPTPPYRLGKPIKGSLETIRGWQSRHELVVFTARQNHKVVEDWLNYFGFPYMRVTNIKENFDLIIDDRAQHFTDWATIDLDGYFSGVGSQQRPGVDNP